MIHTTLISADQLRTLLSGSKHVVVLDCSHDLFDAQAGQLAYAQGHIPGAHFVAMDGEISGHKTGLNGRHPLPERRVVVDLMRRFGVNDDTQIVTYDANHGTYASRIWWMLRWLGHGSVAVLDGGFAAWKSDAGQVSTDPTPTPAPGHFTDRKPLVEPVSFEAVLANVTTQDKLVVDARANDRFRGENETLDPAGGHIPGAVSRFYKLNLNDDGTFKDAASLAREFRAQFGDRPAEQMIMQCGSGVSACHNLLALEVAGFGTAPLYVGSWSEWCSRKEAPIATGP